MRRLDDPAMYCDEDVTGLAQFFLGKILVSKIGGKTTALYISEAEAYRAPDDRACHAFQNRRTPRTEVMFHRGGHAYIYLCYGIHHLFNIVTAPEGAAHAVLLRAGIPVIGQAVMEKRRAMSNGPKLAGGPGTFTTCLNITTKYHGLDLCAPDSVIQLYDAGIEISKKQIRTGPRIGCESAGEAGRWPWRFYQSWKEATQTWEEQGKSAINSPIFS